MTESNAALLRRLLPDVGMSVGLDFDRVWNGCYHQGITKGEMRAKILAWERKIRAKMAEASRA